LDFLKQPQSSHITWTILPCVFWSVWWSDHFGF